MRPKSKARRAQVRVGICSFAMTAMAWGFPALGAQGEGPLESRVPIEVLQRDLAGRPLWIEGEFGVLESGDLGSAAVLQVKAMAQELGGSGLEEMDVLRIKEDSYGKTHIRLTQALNGLRILAPDVILHIDTASRRVLSVQGQLIDASKQKALLTAQIGEAEAFSSAVAESKNSIEPLGERELAYLPDGEGGLSLVWQIDASSPAGEPFRYLVNALDGRVLDARSLLVHALDRTVYDTQQSPPSINPPDPILISEGGATTPDPEGQAAYDHMGSWFSYFLGVHGHDSADGGGIHPEVSFVHAFYTNPPLGPNVVAFAVNCPPNNPGFHIPCYAIFGDGDGITYGSFALDRDAVAHEMTHGASHFLGLGTNIGEIGAVNEALSDIFAAAIDAYFGNGVTASTWKIAEQSALVPFGFCNAIRCIDNPALDGRSKDYYPDAVFCGAGADPHDNAGIGSLAFYLLSQGGSHPRGVTNVQVQGIGIGEAAQVFYQAYQYLNGGRFPRCDNGVTQPFYEPLRQATVRAAEDIFGYGSSEVESVHAAWCAVGVPGCPPLNQPPVANDDSFTVPVGASSVGITFNQLIANDTDPDGDPLFVVAGSLTQPSCGSLSEQIGQLVYTPIQTFWDGCAESFFYTLSDRAPGNGGLTDTATVSLQPAMEVPIFADGFESNSLSAWSSSRAQGGGSLSVSSGAALVGSYGLFVNLTGTPAEKAYVRDDSPNDEKRYRARFYFDPKEMSLGASDAHSIFNAYDANGTSVLNLSLRMGASGRELSLGALLDNATWASTAWTLIEGEVPIEIAWIASPGPGSESGEIQLSVGGSTIYLTDLDTDQQRIDSIRLGAVGGVDAGTSGSHKIDAFESRRWTRIGPAL